MKKIKSILLVLVVFAMTIPLNPARASDTPHVIDSIVVVLPTVTASVNTWLSTSAPVDYPYWVITYVKETSLGTFVSLSALTIGDPNATYNLNDSNDVAWVGSVIVHEDGSVEQTSGVAVENPSFFDYFLTGAISLWNEILIKNLPVHQAIPYLYVLYSTVKLVLKLTYVLVYSNINLGHLFAVLWFAFSVKLSMATAEFIVFWLKAYNALRVIK